MGLSLPEIGNEGDDVLQPRRRRLVGQGQGQGPVGVAISRLEKIRIRHVQELVAIVLGVDGRQLGRLTGQLAHTAAAVGLIGPGQTDVVAQAFSPSPETVVAGGGAPITADFALYCSSENKNCGEGAIQTNSRLQVQQPWARLLEAMAGPRRLSQMENAGCQQRTVEVGWLGARLRGSQSQGGGDAGRALFVGG